MLTDGPFCGGGDNQFDADLLRVRKVRVTLRVQAAVPALRGTDTTLFKNPGTSQGGDRYVPDYTVSVRGDAAQPEPDAVMTMIHGSARGSRTKTAQR